MIKMNLGAWRDGLTVKRVSVTLSENLSQIPSAHMAAYNYL